MARSRRRNFRYITKGGRIQHRGQAFLCVAKAKSTGERCRRGVTYRGQRCRIHGGPRSY